MPATFVVIEYVDAAGQRGTYRQRISDRAPSTEDQGDFTNFISALEPLVTGAYRRAYMEIPFASGVAAPGADSDVRKSWKMTGIDSVSGFVDTIGIPGRNAASSLLSGGKGILADLSDADWTFLQTTWNDSSAMMYLIDARSGNHFQVDTGFAQVRSRVRPRVGSRR